MDIPLRVSFFIWNSSLDKNLTLNYLQNGGWNFANRCILCMEEEESASHLFIHCSAAKRVWDFFISHLQIPWVFPRLFNDLITCWWVCGLGSLSTSIWCAICWRLWKERNSRIFEDKVRSQEEMVISIYKSLFEWASIWANFDDVEWYSIGHEEL